MAYKNIEDLKRYRRQYAITNREKLTAKAMEYKRKHRARVNELQNKRRAERYRTDPEFREKQREAARIQSRKRRAKRALYNAQHRKSIELRARRKAQKAVRCGKLIRPDACDACGTREARRIEAHHPDYSKPLEVLWLCTLCHGAIHASHGVSV